MDANLAGGQISHFHAITSQYQELRAEERLLITEIAALTKQVIRARSVNLANSSSVLDMIDETSAITAIAETLTAKVEQFRQQQQRLSHIRTELYYLQNLHSMPGSSLQTPNQTPPLGHSPDLRISSQTNTPPQGNPTAATTSQQPLMETFYPSYDPYALAPNAEMIDASRSRNPSPPHTVDNVIDGCLDLVQGLRNLSLEGRPGECACAGCDCEQSEGAAFRTYRCFERVLEDCGLSDDGNEPVIPAGEYSSQGLNLGS